MDKTKKYKTEKQRLKKELINETINELIKTLRYGPKLQTEPVSGSLLKNVWSDFVSMSTSNKHKDKQCEITLEVII